MDTNNSKGGSESADDLLEGLLEVEIEHSTDPNDVNPDVKNFLVIDERFKELAPEEGLARTIQSKIGAVKTELNKEIEKSESLGQAARFLDSLKSDPELRQAWLSEIDPDYAQDIDSIVTGILKKEYKDFEPVNEDKDTPSSTTAKYYRKWSQLYQKFENNDSKKTVKEVLASREKDGNKAQDKLNTDLTRIYDEEKWDDDTKKAFVSFAERFDIFAVKKVFKFKLANIRKSSLGTKSTSSGVIHPDKMTKTITTMYGKPKSGKMLNKEK